MPIDTGGPTTGPPPTGRGPGPWPISSSLTKSFPRRLRLLLFSVVRLACFSFLVLFAFFSRTGGAPGVQAQVGVTGPRLATSARLRAPAR